jgi:hypothetical protein
VSGLGAQASNSAALQVGLNTGAAGVFNGTASVDFLSQNPDMGDLNLGALAVTLMGQVNNYAVGALDKTAGDGTLTEAGLTYTLDFGSLFFDTGIYSTDFRAFNDVTGPADLLDGIWDVTGVNDFTLSGFNAFANLAAGGSFSGLMVLFDTATHALGFFTDTILLHSTGHNASGYSAALGDITLVLQGRLVNQPVPEPAMLLLFGLGMTGLVVRLRRQGRKALDGRG